MSPPPPSAPLDASFPSSHLTIGAGVAIFHLASGRVVVCRHGRSGAWFLPKGRRDADEATPRAAEREGFEESGFANRVLPLPLHHRQTGPARAGFVVEPLWTQLMPVTASVQYLLFWHVAETLPPVGPVGKLEGGAGAGAEAGAGGAGEGFYVPPTPFPRDMTLRQRMALDVTAGGEVYVPVRQENTGVNADELLYESFLLPVDEAREKLRGSVMEDVIARGWEAIKLRIRIEDELAETE